jgi:hypothetical protein
MARLGGEAHRVSLRQRREELEQQGRESSRCRDCLILVRIVALPDVEAKVQQDHDHEKSPPVRTVEALLQVTAAKGLKTVSRMTP